MSKFFKALENAERERQGKQVAEAPAAAETVESVAPVAAVEAAAPIVDAPPRAFSRRATALAPTTPVAPPTPDAAPPPPLAAASATAAVAAPPAPPAVPASPAPSAAPGRTPVYGAPLVRDASAPATHRRAFDGILPPASTAEPGEVDDHLVSLLEPTSAAAEQYRTVRLHIENLRRQRGTHVVAISSPSRGDGKTISAINVAGALAQAPDAHVALVEVDVRHPSVARYLGLSGHRGLSTYLLDHTMDVDGVVERPSGVGFAVIAAGPASSMPYELLKSPRLGALFTALRQRFDFIVVDTPPVLPFPDVGIVRDLVDGFLLVVRANRTPRETVRDSLGALGQDRVLGVVFNDDERAAAVAPREETEGWRSVLSRPRGGTRAA